MKLEKLRAADIDRVRPLWLALHAHHQAVAPRLAPFVTDEVSWRERRRQYAEALAADGFGFIACEADSDIGYLVCAKRPMQWNATFAIASTLWELVTVFVSPDRRGKGIGSQLLDAMDARIDLEKLRTKLIGAIPDNRSAIDLYTARGFTPAWLTLTRFQRPSPTAKPPSAIEIKVVSPDAVDGLESLWLSLHHHHQIVSPHLGPWVNDEASWPIIRDLLAKSAQQGLTFVAKGNGGAIGLASTAVYDIADVPAYADTWLTDEQIAETKFLVVAAGSRGKGVGLTLMDAVDNELVRRGVHDHFVGAIEPNRGAIRFYESRGFRPAWLELIKP
jgi:GNAT superfamily N-acetyltransferase